MVYHTKKVSRTQFRKLAMKDRFWLASLDRDSNPPSIKISRTKKMAGWTAATGAVAGSTVGLTDLSVAVVRVPKVFA